LSRHPFSSVNDIVFAFVNFVIRDITAADQVARDFEMRGRGSNEEGSRQRSSREISTETARLLCAKK